MQAVQDNSIYTGVVPLFMALIRCGIGKARELPHTPTPEQWNLLYHFSCKQAVQGIAFAGIEKLPEHQRPPSHLIIKWFQVVNLIRSRNRELTEACILVTRKFAAEGFRSTILKGQGISRYYSDPSLRVPGDIDIWLEGGCDKVIDYVKSIFPACRPVYHHVDFPVLDGLDVEAHYRPSWMYSPFRNSRLQRYFESRSEAEFANVTLTPEGELHMPSVAFNLVYIPVHIYRHLFVEGIGMRQILDYYYVLQQQVSDEEKRQCVETFKSLGMMRFMRALMYVMQQMFDLDHEQMIVPPATRDGIFLLNEIMESGNFGKQDSRYTAARRGANLRYMINQCRRSLMLVVYYPSETLWNPIFKVWHALWRKHHASFAATGQT